MRVESQTTRQALLVVGDTMEADPPPEKLELYTEDGLAVDVGKDRTRARWRGEWEPAPTAPYEQNDFVMHDDKLYILSDFDAYNGVDAPPAAGWAIMTISAGMQFFGEWAPGAFKAKSVVTRDDKLWIANEDIVVDEFEYVGYSTDTSTSGGGSAGDLLMPVPEGTVAGDLLVYTAVTAHYAVDPGPTDGGWTQLALNPLEVAGFPAARAGVWVKIAEADDIGDTKGVTGLSVASNAMLFALNGASLPTVGMLTSAISRVDSLPTPLSVSAGSDPTDTDMADKVLRIFHSYSQNFAIDSGNNPSWSGSGGEDRLMFDNHEVEASGSYWADAGASGLPSFIVNAGEHKMGIRFVLRLPSPAGWDETKWTMIGLLVAEGGASLPAGGSDGQVLTKQSAADDDVAWEAVPVPHDLPVGGASGYLLAKSSSADRDVGWIAVPHDLPAGGSTGQILQKASGSDRDVAWASQAAGAGYKGDWASGTTYPAGAIVRYNGELWGTLSSIVTVAPDASTGSPIGSPARGIQGKDIDRMDDGVLYTKTFTVDTPVDSGGLRAIPLMVDFVGSNANMTLTFANRSDSSIKIYIDGSGGAADSINDLAQGASGTRSIRWGSFWGGSDPHMILLEGNDSDILGEVDVTISGADTVAPASFTPNPWVRLTYHTRPIVSSLPASPFDGQVIAYQNAAMAAQGVVWELRYRAGASGSYKWEFMGGGALYLYDSAQYNATQSSYGYGGTSQLVVPLVGDYEFDFSAWVANDSTTDTTLTQAGVGIGGVVDPLLEVGRYTKSAPQYSVTTHHVKGVKTGVAASAVVRPMFKATTGLAYIERARIIMRPIRVG